MGAKGNGLPDYSDHAHGAELMTDRPIIFSGPMVRALLDGSKTMTRRLAWRREDGTNSHDGEPDCWFHPTVWQKARPGDRLWARENFYLTDDGDNEYAVYAADETASAEHINNVGNIAARHGLGADWLKRHIKLRPSIYMPRWASRLTLLVTEKKLELLQEISHADMRAEGLQAWESTLAPARCMNPRRSFGNLWNTLHKPGDLWEDNPEIVAMGGTVHKVNIDQMEQAA